MGQSFGTAPGIADFEILAHAALRQIGAPFARHLTGVVIAVEEFPDEEAVEAVGLDDPWLLTGLYEGRSLDETSIWSSGEMPPRITLYRQPLLAEWCETGVTLQSLITHVIVHEVGHHFGLSDAQMHAMEMRAG